MPNPVITPGGAPDLAGFREVYPMQRTFWTPAHPSNYRSPRRNPHDWVGIVWHTPEEKAHDDIFVAPWWFQQIHPGREGSTYLALEGDGDLFQCVRFSDYAFAQGSKKTPDPGPPALRDLPSFNNGLMSIEVEGRAKTISLTFLRGSLQWTGAVRFAAWFLLEHALEVSRDTNFGHNEIPNQSHWDPNFSADTWRWLLEDINLETEKLRSINAADEHTHMLWNRWQTGAPIQG